MRRQQMRAFVLWIAIALAAPAALSAAASAGPQDQELASPKLRIDWDAFKKLYDAKGVVIVDVRSAASFESGHIPGARSIPLNDVAGRAVELKKLGKPVVFYCA
jgi:3-mercaptopyruvate sulfurtransferase SseA